MKNDYQTTRRLLTPCLAFAVALLGAQVARAQVMFQEFTEAKAPSKVTSITLSTPLTTVQGDLLIAAVATDGNEAAALAPPVAEGWIQIALDEDADGKVTLGVWYKLAGASESPTHQ